MGLGFREFPTIRGTLFWGPYNQDSYYLGCYIGAAAGWDLRGRVSGFGL